MRLLVYIVPAIVLLVSFLILGIYYDSLPSETLIARALFGGEPTIAPKSLFTVFRVPLIELVSALAVVVMALKPVSDGSSKAYRTMWSVLLFAVSFKSLFQSLESVSGPNWSPFFFYATIAVVAAGILTAIFAGRTLFTAESRKDWYLSGLHKSLIFVLLIAYIGIAIVPIFLYRN